MGTAVAEALAEAGDQVVARVGRGDDLAAARGADVAFEFTGPATAPDNVLGLLELGVPTVCGTTGWDLEPVLRRAAELQTPLLVAANFSPGVAVVEALAALAARRLLALPGFVAGLVEVHHGGKRDQPSGTAHRLAAAVATPQAPAPAVVSLRLGGQPGEHRIVLDGPDETVEIIHRTRSRRPFATGAVAAARWLVAHRPPGPVTFHDSLQEIAP
jgi:4-hydroxy-tetrahydrodipicolinate reductase